MLSAAQLRGVVERRRTPYSDKQHYQEYILQRIEGFKNSIGRDELLRLGDEAASELQSASEGQFLLTEVLMLESVDRLIMKRLALRPYSRWRRQFALDCIDPGAINSKDGRNNISVFFYCMLNAPS